VQKLDIFRDIAHYDDENYGEYNPKFIFESPYHFPYDKLNLL